MEKEKMLKSCKKLKNVITGFLWLIVGCMIVPVVIGLVLSISIIFQPNNEKKVEVGDNMMQVIENITNKVNEFEEGMQSINEIKATNSSMTVIKFVMTCLILNHLIKILKSTIEKETPFTEDNIKYMKKIDIYALINWVVTTPFVINVGLIYVLVISTITYIFEYGYQLQQQSDETL